ncbi:MAG TPA: cytochrome c biogenesis protein CcsA [Gammaproteobacteria bacterium]|jgi:ABC-type uncharacterized transport system permease subunit
MQLTGTAVLDLVLYLLAALGLLLRLLQAGPTLLRGSRGFTVSAAIAAVFIHTVLLYGLVATPHGLDLGYFNALALAGWLMALIALATFLKPDFENLGLALFPLAGISMLCAELFPHDVLIMSDRSWPLDLHIVTSMLAYSLLGVAALQAAVLYVQERSLRRGSAGGVLAALPPMQEMERFLFQLIGAGFVLLSFSLFTGLIFVQNLHAQHLEHKTILSGVAWLVFAVLLWGHWKFGWRGRTATGWTLSGFGFLLLAYFGSKLVLELILGRHW